MLKTYTREQLWGLYSKLPEELKIAVSSSETNDAIFDTCERYEIERVKGVAEAVRNVLMGILPPTEFQGVLEKDIGVSAETAKGITHEINRLVFYPVKSTLEELYKITIAAPAGLIKPEVAPSPKSAEQPETAEKKEEEPQKTSPAGGDTYREAIE